MKAPTIRRLLVLQSKICVSPKEKWTRTSRSQNRDLGYVHAGPVPSGSDPILERTISVHMAPFQATAGTAEPGGGGCNGKRNDKEDYVHRQNREQQYGRK